MKQIMISQKQRSAYVFKTMVDPFIGKYSFIKVCSGVLKGDDVLYNADSDAEEKLGKIVYDVRKQTGGSQRIVCR